MYDQALVKRNKRRKITSIVTGICAVGVTAMCIVAFLGRHVGTFTVNLEQSGVNLTMDTHSNFENSTSYLAATNVDKFSAQYSYEWFTTSQSCNFKTIHNESTDWTIGKDGGSKGIRFFKYTFFVKNIGEVDADYDFKINLIDNVKPSNAYALDEYLRIMIFEDDKQQVYARRSLTQFEATGESHEEDICYPEYSGTDFGKATMFKGDDLLIDEKSNIKVGQVKMYTVLFWLEGTDPEGTYFPDKASLKFGVRINGYPGSIQ